jgi:putative PIN family toxin of toxin-antitoxin system
MTTAVFDCVVILQAAANQEGPAGACLAFVEAGQVQLFLSPPILNEARDVFARPETRKRFPKLTDNNVERFLLKLAALATLVHDIPVAMQLPRDPADEPYLNLAIAMKVSFIVTRDPDMLSLMEDESFKTTYPTLSIIDPPAFLHHVRAEITREPGST